MNALGNRTTGGGGMATQAGIGYQNRVAAWLCVRILSERARPGLFFAWVVIRKGALQFRSKVQAIP